MTEPTLEQQMAALGPEASNYCDKLRVLLAVSHSSPELAIAGARTLLEDILGSVLQAEGLAGDRDLLNNIEILGATDGKFAARRRTDTQGSIPPPILPKLLSSGLHTLRIYGNEAVHPRGPVSANADVTVLTQADFRLVLHLILRLVEWYFQEYSRGSRTKQHSSMITLNNEESQDGVDQSFMIQNSLDDNPVAEAHTPESLIPQKTIKASSPAITFQQSFEDIAKDIDEQWPFPIAYCFRSVNREMSAAPKWHKMLELYEVTLKYITICLLASLDDTNTLSDAQRASLSRPALGHWHSLCFSLLKQTPQPDSFLKTFLEAAGQNKKIEQHAYKASERLNKARNNTKHGYSVPGAEYRQWMSDHAQDLRSFLNLAEPLARYTLIRPVKETLSIRRGMSRYEALIMMGSHPDFRTAPYETKGQVETDCLLQDPEAGKFLSLYPWLFMDECQECLREGIFLYDTYSYDGEVIVREFPNNHTKLGSKEQAQSVQEWIGARRLRIPSSSA